jgi:transglutaminase-like putative cysteine protease
MYSNHLVVLTSQMSPPVRKDEVDLSAEELPVEKLPGEVLHFTLPSRYCLSDLLSDKAWELFGSIPPGCGRVQAICDWVHSNIRFQYGTSSPLTTAADVCAQGVGVCRDFAHLAVTFCRAFNIPARYVSGHLLGEGSTHAWVEVLLPVPIQDGQPVEAIALPLDPTHGCETSLNYLTIAVGRDYYDVAPTSGTFRAPYRGELTASKRVGPISLEYTENGGKINIDSVR